MKLNKLNKIVIWQNFTAINRPYFCNQLAYRKILKYLSPLHIPPLSSSPLSVHPMADVGRDRGEPRLPQPFFFILFSIYLKNNFYKLLFYLY